MKYPQPQFELLKDGLAILDSFFELDKVHPCQLQYLLFQQASEGQKHNALFINESGNSVVKGFVAERLTGYKKLITFLNEVNFPLYPKGCDDSHIETAVKSALKSIKKQLTIPLLRVKLQCKGIKKQML